MKNNKTTTYILLLIVMGLWVVVFYRVYKSFFANDEVAATTQVALSKKKINIDETEVFVLKANYSDPFMGKVIPVNINRGSNGGSNRGSRVLNDEGIRNTSVRVNKPKKEFINIDWSFINYIGLIKNQQSKKQVALVSINGREVMASEGDVIEDVSFIKNYKDSIKVSYQGHISFIKK